jgi:hypothetical protein
MQANSHISLLVAGSADYYVQERIRKAERDALVREAKGRRPSIFASIRQIIGHSMVRSGSWIAGCPQRRQERALDTPIAFKIAR